MLNALTTIAHRLTDNIRLFFGCKQKHLGRVREGAFYDEDEPS
jgi:hypothetical protein